jgi:hypothetical protein
MNHRYSLAHYNDTIFKTITSADIYETQVDEGTLTDEISLAFEILCEITLTVRKWD